MAKKTPSKKATAKKASKAPTPAAKARAESARFERQGDLDVLRRAEEVRTDPGRMAAVKREAADQQRTIAKVVKR